MFWNSRAGPSRGRPEHVLGNLPRTCSGRPYETALQAVLETVSSKRNTTQSMLWATVQNCFKYTKIQGRACSGLQSKLFPKLLQVHKNTTQSMFWATVWNMFWATVTYTPNCFLNCFKCTVACFKQEKAALTLISSGY